VFPVVDAAWPTTAITADHGVWMKEHTYVDNQIRRNIGQDAAAKGQVFRA
jgi:hypothetical protein